MMQSFDFLSKSYKHVLIQNIKYLSQLKKTLDTALHKKTLYQHAKTYVYINQTNLYTNFLEYTGIDFSMSTQTVSHLQHSSLDWLNYLVYS